MIRRIIAPGWRQLLLLAALLTFAGLIARNLFYWQVTEHARIAQAAARIYDSQTNIPALRAASSILLAGGMAARSRETSLPSCSPNPPGSTKSRWKSIISSAVDPKPASNS